MVSVPSSAGYITNFSRSSEIWFMPVWKDKDGNVLQNTAKGPLPKPQVEPVAVGIIRGTVRKPSYSDANYKEQLNCVNAGGWRGWDAGQAWCAKIQTRDINENGVNYTLVRYTILCCEHSWKAIFPDIGYYYIESSKAVVFADTNGLPYIGALNGSGGKLAVSSNLQVIEKAVKRPVNFSFLGF